MCTLAEEPDDTVGSDSITQIGGILNFGKVVGNVNVSISAELVSAAKEEINELITGLRAAQDGEQPPTADEVQEFVRSRRHRLRSAFKVVGSGGGEMLMTAADNPYVSLVVGAIQSLL